MIIGAEEMIGFILIGIQVHLAHRADCYHRVRFMLIGGCNQSPDHLKGGGGLNL